MAVWRINADTALVTRSASRARYVQIPARIHRRPRRPPRIRKADDRARSRFPDAACRKDVDDTIAQVAALPARHVDIFVRVQPDSGRSIDELYAGSCDFEARRYVVIGARR